MLSFCRRGAPLKSSSTSTRYGNIVNSKGNQLKTTNSLHIQTKSWEYNNLSRLFSINLNLSPISRTNSFNSHFRTNNQPNNFATLHSPKLGTSKRYYFQSRVCFQEDEDDYELQDKLPTTDLDLSQFPLSRIRNFAVIAHIGK
jgi:hypothetical protein